MRSALIHVAPSSANLWATVDFPPAGVPTIPSTIMNWIDPGLRPSALSIRADKTHQIDLLHIPLASSHHDITVLSKLTNRSNS